MFFFCFIGCIMNEFYFQFPVILLARNLCQRKFSITWTGFADIWQDTTCADTCTELAWISKCIRREYSFEMKLCANTNLTSSSLISHEKMCSLSDKFRAQGLGTSSYIVHLEGGIPCVLFSTVVYFSAHYEYSGCFKRFVFPWSEG